MRKLTHYFICCILLLQHGYLRVIVPADISQISGAENVMEGGDVQLKCEATGYPQPSVYWRREGRDKRITVWDKRVGRKREGEENIILKLFVFKLLIKVEKVEGNVLLLHRIKRSQMGKYLCIATNGFPPAVSRTVNLKVNCKFNFVS